MVFLKDYFISIFVFLYMCTLVSLVVVEARRGWQIPWSWGYRWLSLLTCVLGTKLVLCKSSLSMPLFCGLVCQVCRNQICVKDDGRSRDERRTSSGCVEAEGSDSGRFSVPS